jgi:hypothetical protein
MHANPQNAATFRVHELRREGGRWLKEKREQSDAIACGKVARPVMSYGFFYIPPVLLKNIVIIGPEITRRDAGFAKQSNIFLVEENDGSFHADPINVAAARTSNSPRRRGASRRRILCTNENVCCSARSRAGGSIDAAIQISSRGLRIEGALDSFARLMAQ